MLGADDLLIICILFVFVSLTAITSAHHSWRKFHWARQSNPFTIKLGNNVSSGWVPRSTRLRLTGAFQVF